MCGALGWGWVLSGQGGQRGRQARRKERLRGRVEVGASVFRLSQDSLAWVPSLIAPALPVPSALVQKGVSGLFLQESGFPAWGRNLRFAPKGPGEPSHKLDLVTAPVDHAGQLHKLPGATQPLSLL